MSEGGTVYKYTVPLDNTGGISSPAYNLTPAGEVLTMRVGATECTFVCTEVVPHYHKDSMNINVEEVDESEYRD